MKQNGNSLTFLLIIIILHVILTPINALAQTMQRPPVLMCTNVTTTSVQLKWADNSEGELGFDIVRGTPDSNTGKMVGRVGPNIKEFTDSGLIPGTKYVYRVYALGINVTKIYPTGIYNPNNFSNEVTVVTNFAPPAPSNLVLGYDQASISLSWNDNSNCETGFIIERRSKDEQYKIIYTTSADVKKYSDSTISKGVEYYYRVKAMYFKDSSISSNEAKGCLGGTVHAPSNLVASLKGKEVILTWKDNANNEDYFIIEKSSDNVNYTALDRVDYDSPGYGYKIGNSSETRWFYRVRAGNSWGISECSNVAEISLVDKTKQNPNTKQNPCKPITIKLVIGNKKLLLNDKEKSLSVVPMIKNGIVYLPVKDVIELLGAKVKLDSKNKKMTISINGKSCQLTVGSSNVSLNGKKVYVDPNRKSLAPIMISGNMLVPMDFLTRNLGITASCNSKTGEIIISYK